MLFRNTMILVLVVWLLVGWVRSYNDVPSHDDRDRQAHLRRRMLERLARRGYEERERERVAEELLARLKTHHFTSSSDVSVMPERHQRDPYRRSSSSSSSLPHRRPSIFEESSSAYPEIESYDQIYPQLEILREEADTPMFEEMDAPEYETSSAELEQSTEEMLRDYLIREVRHVTEKKTRLSREERRREREEKRRKKEEKKKKRASRKNKQSKRSREFEMSLRNQNITIHEHNGSKYFDCCPSKLEVVEITVGKNRNNAAVEVKEGHRLFYQRACLPEYKGKDCIFPAKSTRKGLKTRCEELISYTQAIIRTYQSDEEFKIGHIQVRSGCSCQVSLNTKKKKKRKR